MASEKPIHYACSPAPISFKKTKTEELENKAEEEVPSNVFHAVIAQGKLWDNKSNATIEITYGFETSAPEEMKAAVSTTIATWEKYANVKFAVQDWANAQIRISFDKNKGSWSAIGTDAKNSAFDQKATMNFGWLEKAAVPSASDRGTILHEFGHALGMMHEHQSPARGGTITLNEHEVYRYYRPLLQNRDDLVKSQVIDVYNLSEVSNYSSFDDKSIMMYSMPGYLNEQKRDIQANIELSELDKAFIMLNYPGRVDTDMTLDKALRIAGVFSSEVANDIKGSVAAGKLNDARTRLIGYNNLAMDSVKVNASVLSTRSELSKQFALDPQETNKKFENIVNKPHFQDMVGTLVKQVFLQHGVAATTNAILPKISEDYVSDVVDALVVHPAIVGAVNAVMDGLLVRNL